MVDAGANIVAVDAIDPPRPRSEPLPELVDRIHDELGVPVLGDVDNLDSATFALAAGVNALATTASGYTGSFIPEYPDLDLVQELVALERCPVFA